MPLSPVIPSLSRRKAAATGRKREVRTPASTCELEHRVFLTLMAAIVSAILVSRFVARPEPPDFFQPWAGARVLLHGGNPYDLIGPGRPIPSPWPLVYPMTAVVAAAPVAWLPVAWASVLFFAAGAAALMWSLTVCPRDPRLWVFASFAFLLAATDAQWSPLLTAVALAFPSLGFFLACKPTIGAALFCAYPSRRAFVWAAAFVLVTVVLSPHWISAWRVNLSTLTHLAAPITYPGGFLLAAAALRWRRADARLILALACVPQSAGLYESVPLFLVVSRGWEGALLSFLTAAVWVTIRSYAPHTTYVAFMAFSGRWILWLLYLPCLAFVLRRPNTASEGDGVIIALRWLKELLMARMRRSAS